MDHGDADNTMEMDGGSAHEMVGESAHEEIMDSGSMETMTLDNENDVQVDEPAWLGNLESWYTTNSQGGGVDESLGPDMTEAVNVANSDEVVSSPGKKRRLRGARKMETETHGSNIFHGGESMDNGHKMDMDGDEGHNMAPQNMATEGGHTEPMQMDGGHSSGSSHSNMDNIPDDGHNMPDGAAGHQMAAGGEVEHPRRPIEEGIYTMDGPAMVDESQNVPYLAPAWHIFPLMGNEGRMLFNEYSDAQRRRAIDTMMATNRPALTELLVGWADHHHYYKDPSSVMLYPVHDSFDDNSNTMMGFISITFSWIGAFWNILPANVR